MERKTECEIVEDLLFGYADGVLNKESEKLVESHLVECPQCQSKLTEIKSDKDSGENNTKKEIDYLKKIRSTFLCIVLPMRSLINCKSCWMKPVNWHLMIKSRCSGWNLSLPVWHFPATASILRANTGNCTGQRIEAS